MAVFCKLYQEKQIEVFLIESHAVCVVAHFKTLADMKAWEYCMCTTACIQSDVGNAALNVMHNY